MSFKSKVFGTAVALAMLGAAGAARADGLAAKAADLAQADRTKLIAEVAAYKQQDPQAFAAVASIKGYRPEVYMQYRNPRPHVGPELRRLGKAALLPMLEALVLEKPDLHGANDVERQAVVEGMVAAVGQLRDARAVPALTAIFGKTQALPVTMATGRALGRTCEAGGALKRLETGLRDAARRGAAIEGLGECRTLTAAKLLASELDKAGSADEAQAIAKALGSLGSSWAWNAIAQTGGDAKRTEGLAAREAAAAAVVRGFVRFDGAARGEHRRALEMIAHPETRRIAGTHGSSDAATKRELEEAVVAIETRLAH
jgi:hypothetical protein